MKKFYGLSTLWVGLEKSRNLMTVRIAQNLGVEKIVDFSKALKFMIIQRNFYLYLWDLLKQLY